MIEDEDFGVSVIHMQRRSEANGPIVMNFDKLMVNSRKQQLKSEASSFTSESKTNKKLSYNVFEHFCAKVKLELFK